MSQIITIQSLEKEISDLRSLLKEKEAQLIKMKTQNEKKCIYSKELSTEEVVRYSRQMIMSEIQLSGQIALKKSKVLIVGAGGLGCPAALYLAAAGIGEIHLMDYDDVELSNLHRQILHHESDIGIPKVQSASEKLSQLNSNITIVPLHLHATTKISETISQNDYNVVLDCTDNAPTRYLLNDLCILHKLPLVSGSALKMEGQLTVYNHNEGPCYRCLFPVPPPAFTVTNCGDGGVLGAIPGTIGVLQALETIKIITKSPGVLSKRLLLFDGAETTFRNVKLRERRSNCICTGNKNVNTTDYEEFCGLRAHDKVIDIDMLSTEESVNATHLPELLKEKKIIVDVRPELEYAMCKLPGTINVPYAKIEDNKGLEELLGRTEHISGRLNVYVLCRRGNDSQRAVECLKKHFKSDLIRFINIRGGLHAFGKHVDPSFPIY